MSKPTELLWIMNRRGPPVMTPETSRAINIMTSRFFLIREDGTVDRLNEYGKAIDWCFKRRATALLHARRRLGVWVYDKIEHRWID